MDESIEIHDSTLAGATSDGDDLILHFRPAYLHRSEGEPGVDPGTGWVQDLDLIVAGARLLEFPARVPASLYEGEFSAGDRLWWNSIPVEPPPSGPIAIVAITERGERLAVVGAGLRIASRRDLRFIEEFPVNA